jgi:hypothetical protein
MKKSSICLPCGLSCVCIRQHDSHSHTHTHTHSHRKDAVLLPDVVTASSEGLLSTDGALACMQSYMARARESESKLVSIDTHA